VLVVVAVAVHLLSFADGYGGGIVRGVRCMQKFKIVVGSTRA
jgi:hypothetical protein